MGRVKLRLFFRLFLNGRIPPTILGSIPFMGERGLEQLRQLMLHTIMVKVCGQQ
jgi:hypothetical protein